MEIRDAFRKENLYYVTSTGEVWTKPRLQKDKRYGEFTQHKQIKSWVLNSGYLYIKLGKDYGCLVHRLIWQSFNGELKEGEFINHINGNKLDNRIENLEKVTFIENIEHAFNTGLYAKEFDRKQSTITKEQLDFCYLYLSKGFSRKLASEISGVPEQTIANIIGGRIYKSYTEKFQKFRKKIPR